MNNSLKHKHAVVLLHGILLPKAFMTPLARHLQHQGFTAFNFSYPSRSYPINALGTHICRKINQKNIRSFDRLHFVGHSMGGLIIEDYLQQHRPDNLGYVVMIGTPHHGSEMADALYQQAWYQWLFGPAGQELTTFARQKWAGYKADYPLGSIAGTRHPFYWPANQYFYGPHDGRVSVSSTQILGMQDHICLPCDHTTLPFMPKTSHQVSAFLKNGFFEHK